MNFIKDLDSIRLNNKALSPPVNDVNLIYGQERIPVLFLVDVSGTMKRYQDIVNEQLNQLIYDIRNARDGTRYSVDLAIMTFGGGRIHIQREFDLLLDKSETLQIDTCDGNTPLGAAMLHAYYYTAKRKKMYIQADIKNYTQPTVVLISDLRENAYNFTAEVDNRRIPSFNTYSKQPELFNEMAELYSQMHKETRKQFTYFIGIGDNVDTGNLEKLDGIATIDSFRDIEQALAKVRAAFKASWRQALSSEAKDIQEFVESSSNAVESSANAVVTNTVNPNQDYVAWTALTIQERRRIALEEIKKMEVEMEYYDDEDEIDYYNRNTFPPAS